MTTPSDPQIAGEKPLHVRVAEALGLVECDKWKVWGVSVVAGTEWYKDTPCGHAQCYAPGCAPRFDTDWSATGPPIEKYGIDLGADHPSGTWKLRPGCDECGRKDLAAYCTLDSRGMGGAPSYHRTFCRSCWHKGGYP